MIRHENHGEHKPFPRLMVKLCGFEKHPTRRFDTKLIATAHCVTEKIPSRTQCGVSWCSHLRCGSGESFMAVSERTARRAVPAGIGASLAGTHFQGVRSPSEWIVGKFLALLESLNAPQHLAQLHGWPRSFDRMNRIYRMGFHPFRVCLVFILSILLILSPPPDLGLVMVGWVVLVWLRLASEARHWTDRTDWAARRTNRSEPSCCA